MLLRQLLLFLLFSSTSSFSFSLESESVHGSCLHSFLIKNPEKTVTLPWEVNQLKCSEAEERRKSLFANQLASYDMYSTNAEIRDAAIESLDQSLQSIESLSTLLAEKKGGITHAQVDNVLSAQMANAAVAAGLITCAETLGGGCLFAGVSALYGAYSAVRSFQAIESLQTDIKTLKSTINSLKHEANSLQSQLLDGRYYAIQEFNRLCTLVQQHCLE